MFEDSFCLFKNYPSRGHIAQENWKKYMLLKRFELLRQRRMSGILSLLCKKDFDKLGEMGISCECSILFTTVTLRS